MQDIFVVPAEFVKKQIDACLDDVGADVVKLGEYYWFEMRINVTDLLGAGMLSSTETIHTIADALTSHAVPAVVLDPVFILLLRGLLDMAC